ncbi:pre-mRNA-splicing factor syf1, partial [Ceratobasidium sp. UAMH 11750]
MPRLWLLYLNIFSHPRCPAPLARTHARRTYDRALRTLPPSLHTRIWPRYLRWAEHAGGFTTVHVFRRYLTVDPSLTEHYAALLLAPENPHPRPLEAAKLLLKLARSAARGEYVSPEGKSAYQLLGEWLDVVEAYAEDIGLDPDLIPPRPQKTDEGESKDKDVVPEPVSSTGTLIRLAGPMEPATTTTGDNTSAPRPVMQRATAIPKNMKISYHDQSLPVQARLFKSLKLWSCYVDLEEAIGTVETTKAVYDKMLELKIANAQIIVNYASFLEDNDYFEDSFKVYERGVELFTFPIAFELWNIYLAKFIKRYGGTKLERARDLFEQALDKCPQKHCKPLFLMYAKLEEEHGLAKRAMDVYDRATQVVADQDKFEMFTIYIAKASANFGLPATRPIYERALQALPNKQTAEMCLRFAQLERKLGEIDRARAIFAHASQFCDPRTASEFWKAWNTFEIETGSEDTFREMLRIKRAVQAQYNTEVSFLAAQASMAREGGAKKAAAAAAVESTDAMAAVENEARGKAGPA